MLIFKLIKFPTTMMLSFNLALTNLRADGGIVIGQCNYRQRWFPAAAY